MKTKIYGFTLIEVMIVVAIIGILSSIAIPSYQGHVTKAKRTEAQGQLVSFANAMEQWFLEKGTYKGAATGGNDTGTPTIFSATVPATRGTKTYDLTITSATDTGYTLQATPSAISTQYEDGWLALDNLGIKTCSAGNGSVTTTAASVTPACPNLNGTVPTW